MTTPEPPEIPRGVFFVAKAVGNLIAYAYLASIFGAVALGIVFLVTGRPWIVGSAFLAGGIANAVWSHRYVRAHSAEPDQ